VQGLEDFSKIEIDTAFIVFGNTISDIERTDKGVKPDKKAAGCNQIVEVNIINILPGIACLQRTAQISGYEVKIPYAPHVDQLQQTELLTA